MGGFDVGIPRASAGCSDVLCQDVELRGGDPKLSRMAEGFHPLLMSFWWMPMLYLLGGEGGVVLTRRKAYCLFLLGGATTVSRLPRSFLHERLREKRLYSPAV